MTAKTVDRSQVSVRKLHSGYYEAAVSIDRECAENFWNIDDFKRHCRKPNCTAFVVLHRSTPIGFMAYEYLPLEGEIHILNMGVRGSARRLGVGTMLVNRMKRKMGPEYGLLQIVVRETNYVAQKFLQNNSFRARLSKRYFVDYYQDRTECEDGYCFEYRQAERSPGSGRQRPSGPRAVQGQRT